ncbi:serine protease inhibitor Kazal-type 8 [Peromyscus maniculatus bairdii]|uniref:serine protease inhibitor Kazal-type 8 n=1 Tax=Peromyscus maniculatus bairdii TaxID=230844 RepID=UPI00042ACAD1|nr:serine protease inhibitor Kazal-type 8 [Peromyscus maniculatus bairdii]XP_042137641.1 serine protease inhibitor Kazal-type 8 [Peromyscus maniculatus bairdii]XP_042137642.1 serine protease inhibitor Kazal-type 8 [Peromyscus maniculatus bairdii]XP_042137643.1 serine protease inhibitor Kazal-type 8 [Peromyscus maniculatus bairdii]
MKATFSMALLVLTVSVWTSFAVDFPLPMASHMTDELFQETKDLCQKNVRNCWIVSYYNPSEPICASDHATYHGECHLCSRILYESRTIIKMHDGECIYSLDESEQE